MKKNNTYISSQLPGMWTSVASHINTAFWESTVCTSPLERGLGGVLFPPAQAFSHQWVTVGRDNTLLPLSRGEAQTALFHRATLMAQPVGGKEAGCKKRKGHRIGTYILLLVNWIMLLGHVTAAHAEGIRIRPESVKVENDSLRIHLLMDLSSVKVASGEAYIFTPFLRGDKIHLALPPVIVTGSRRARFDRRERALSSAREAVEPYRIIVDNHKRPSKEITYRLSIPYASWMLHAGLALTQENKTCCVKRILSVDTLTPDIAAACSPAEGSVIPHAQPKPLPPMAAASAEIATEVLTPKPVIALPVASTDMRPAVVAGNYLSMVSYLEPLIKEKEKSRIKEAVLYIDYPLNKYEVYLDYKNNRREVKKIDSLLTPVLTNGFSIINSIRICGYASPDGNYGNNERLSSNRSRQFMYYVRDAYSIPEKLFDVSWVAEDWEGTEKLLRKFKPSYYQSALDIIRRYGIFQGRERQLMNLQGGVPYKDMLKNIFPRLRRIEVVVKYDVRKIAVDEARNLIYTHPELLSLEEMYSVAKYYRPGTEQYRRIYEIAASYFPDDIVANVNAASAVILTGDIQSGWNYLRKIDNNPKAWNNMGVLTWMQGNLEEAAQWFRKAIEVEPQKARANLQLVEEMIKKGDSKNRQ